MGKSFLSKIKISYIYFLFMILMLIVTVTILIGAYRSERSIVETQHLTEEYTEAQSAINDLMDASDYLTEQARLFTVSGNVENGLNYQEEIDVTKRRDKALATIKDFGAKQEVYDSLERALEQSNELTETEYYAMLLSAVGHGVSKDDYSKFTNGMKLKKEDLKLTPSQMIDKATDLLFNKAYSEKKEKIREDVSGSLNELLQELHDRQIGSYESAAAISRREHIAFIATLIGTLIMLFLTAFLVVDPIRKSTKLITDKEPLPTKGSSEFYHLAEAYNKMLSASMAHQERLSYDATHDDLTDLYNRKMFEQKREELQFENIAMLILDVDKFKNVNDTYGHETGDRVLKKVGAILSSSFRLDDCVCRIGGDEFAVLMRQMDPSLKHVVENKIQMVRNKLAEPDDLPKTTLSIGVAFSEDEDEEENLFKKADRALYSIKESGRDSYAFYQDL